MSLLYQASKPVRLGRKGIKKNLQFEIDTCRVSKIFPQLKIDTSGSFSFPVISLKEDMV
jgi:hypothetical protein